MKRKALIIGVACFAGLLLQGCVALPPLVQVEHKDGACNQEIARRLDRIDQRLAQLEQKSESKSEQK
ncbi:MAG: hypothetical protein ACLQM8_26925 [Limisphaerales bacterium]